MVDVKAIGCIRASSMAIVKTNFSGFNSIVITQFRKIILDSLLKRRMI
jgi:hypothetical protein